MTDKILLFLALRAECPRADAELAVATEAAELLARAPGGASVRAVMALAKMPEGLAHLEATANGPTIQAVLELQASEGTARQALTDAVAGSIRRLGHVVEPQLSAAVAGVEHVIVPGDQPIVLAFALRRLSELTDVRFHDYWLHEHAKLGRKVPGSQGYRQVHTDPAWTKAVVAATGVVVGDFDGVAIAYYEDVERFVGILSNPAIIEPLLADERRFIDHARSVLVLGTTPVAAG